MLQLAAEAYIEAQTSGQPFLLPLAETVSYAENDTPMSIDKGVLAQKVVIDFSRSLFDSKCAGTLLNMPPVEDNSDLTIA
jgi:hypothetical protein